MTIPNHITLDALRQMPIGDIVALPAEHLALLHEEADAALKAAKTLKDWLDGAIGLRYGERASQARVAMAKDTGTVRFADGSVTVVADLPKKVEWDQALLANLEARIAANGDNPREFIDVSYRVSETKFSAWASALREQFIPARTVKVGKPSFRLALLSE